MEGQELKVVAPPAGQTGTPPATGQSEAATQPTVTRDEVLKLVGEAEEKAFRRAQGLITKTNTRIRSEVTKLEQQLTKAGVTLDGNQKAALEQQVTDQVLTEENSAAGEGQPPSTLTDPSLVDPITKVAQQMMDEAGVVIYDNDPEAKLIDMSDPYKFLKSLPAAIEVKKAREKSPVKDATSTPGLSGAGGPTSPYSGKSGLDLISEHFRSKGL